MSVSKSSIQRLITEEIKTVIRNHDVDLEKGISPDVRRGVLHNPSDTWFIKLPVEHIGNEKDGALCGREREDGNIYTTPERATCKRCIDAMKRRKRNGIPLPPIRPNVQEIIQRSLTEWILGKQASVKLRGNKIEVEAIAEALQATKQFNDLINEATSSAESIIDALVKKRKSASLVKKLIGIDWPL